MLDSNVKNQTVNGFVWRLIQNFSTQIIAFVIQIVLARILDPEVYGITAIISTFMTIATVFINTGFTSAIIQKQNLTQLDLSSSFYAGIGVSSVLYITLFLSAPLIASFYEEPILRELLRVQALTIIIGALCSVHQALITKHMKFKKTMLASLISCIAQGITGIILALKGFGVWSLVTASVVHSILYCLVLWIVERWRPKIQFSISSIRQLLSFSIKVLAINLINTLYNNIITLMMGKAYSKSNVAYYSRGNQLPTLIMVNVDGAMTTVLFSSLSKLQNDENTFMQMLRKALRTSLYVCTPLMFGMMAVARPLIQVILTDKWLDSVPFLQISCIVCMTWPLSAAMHAIIAKGRGTVALGLNIMSKAIGLICLIIAVRFDVYYFVMSGIASAITVWFISMFIYKKELKYAISAQLADLCSSVWRAVIMYICLQPMLKLNIAPIVQLVLMIVAGIIIYIGLSVATKSKEFTTIKNLGMSKLHLSKK